MKRPPVFLQNGGSCLSTIVLTISLIRKCAVTSTISPGLVHEIILRYLWICHGNLSHSSWLCWVCRFLIQDQLFSREVVITSVLDEDPPCLGVGGLCKILPVWLAKWTQFIVLKIWVETFISGVHEACIAGEMVQGGLNLFLSIFSW